MWNLAAKTVVLPDDKCSKYAVKLAPWFKGALVTRKDCDSVIGTLNHCSLVIRDGCFHLPSFYKLASSFALNSPSYLLHRVPAIVAADASWWIDRLLNSWCGLDIREPPAPLPTSLFVDASTSWGIGLVLNG